MIFKYIKGNFYYFNFFYRYLHYRFSLTIFLSLVVGLLDGIGLALFIPLIQLALGTGSSNELQQDRISELVLQKLQIEINLINIFLLIFFLFCFKSFFQFFESYLRVLYQQYFMRRIRLENLSLLNEYDYQKFVLADGGRIQNTLGSEVNRLSVAYRQYFKALQKGVMVIVYVGLALSSEWRFTVIVLIGGILMNFLFSYFYKRTKYFSRKFTKETHTFQGLLMQKISNFQYLKATGLNELFSKKLISKINELEIYQKRLGIVEAALGALREPFTILIVFVAIFLYSYFFDEVIGGIILSLLLLYRCITYFISMQEQWNLFLGVSGSIHNLEEFTEELGRDKEKSGDLIFKSFKQDLNLSNVCFSYGNGPEVLNNITLKISKNETIAIVGESGSGKTTLLNLLAGLFYPDKGSFTIDDVSIEKIETNSFKNRIGYIVQNPAIFDDTVFNNISFWKGKNVENILRFNKAIEKAAIKNYIEKLPLKEETRLGMSGINVSGGQRQRFSIARELFKQVDILFMDEATSNLDSETELEIHSNINNLHGEYTIVIVAHRLATVKSADRIVVLKDGRIESVGSYEELLRDSSEFQKMVELQMI